MSVPNDRIVLSIKKKGSQNMTYTITLETFNGSTKKINLASKGAVAQFISTYPTQLPVGVAVKIACDTLGISGTLRGTLTPSNSN
jgi:hypothetical protein